MGDSPLLKSICITVLEALCSLFGVLHAVDNFICKNKASNLEAFLSRKVYQLIIRNMNQYVSP
jgi:hypothetical protein